MKFDFLYCIIFTNMAEKVIGTIRPGYNAVIHRESIIFMKPPEKRETFTLSIRDGDYYGQHTKLRSKTVHKRVRTENIKYPCRIICRDIKYATKCIFTGADDIIGSDTYDFVSNGDYSVGVYNFAGDYVKTAWLFFTNNRFHLIGSDAEIMPIKVGKWVKNLFPGQRYHHIFAKERHMVVYEYFGGHVLMDGGIYTYITH